uniref:DUF1742-domain-containing protein n=1 Tax=Kwoniella bestiolae CBS 10118 TaxID=1296100 RepID=A0A1B9FTF2_9TREE|nr:hypothetical protein I302_08827 [Kwoniella bestiolae CBS 10118]OCF22046.1 hypothetical protein I302_08827 [Kwoniella bestiolae CBS 10118]
MASAAASSSNLQNIYYERKTGTARPCYICNRPTTTVLATIKTEDYLYTCEGHLTDSGFASPIPTPASTSGPSADDIKKVIADYHQREARKNTKDDKDKDKDKDKKDDKDKDKDKDEQEKEEKKEKPSSGPSPSTPSIPTSSTPQPPTHRKFQLHRHIFEMRKNELRRKEQGNKAKEVSRGE